MDKIIDQSLTIKKEKQRMAIWFGLAAGLVFSLALWANDGLILARANAIHPWAKLLMGSVPTIGISILVAWLCYHFENSLLSVIFWVVGGFLVSFLASHIPYEGLTFYYKLFDPEIATRVNYPFGSGVTAHAVIVIFISVIISAICGVMFNLLIDSASVSATKAGILVPLLIWSAFFIVDASLIDMELQQRLRSPLDTLNQLIVRKISSETVPVSKEEARRIHLGALNTVADLVDSPRQLILKNYDPTLIQTTILVNFDGQWTECVVIADQSAEPPVQQPVYCRLAE